MDAEIRAILRQRACADYAPCDGDLYAIQRAVWPADCTDRDEALQIDMIRDYVAHLAPINNLAAAVQLYEAWL